MGAELLASFAWSSAAKPPKKHVLKTGSVKHSGESARIVTLINDR